MGRSEQEPHGQVIDNAFGKLRRTFKALRIAYEMGRATYPVALHQQVVLGPEVAEFERTAIPLVQTEFAVGCNSGFGANLCSLLALKLGKNDSRVAVPAFAPSDGVGVLLRQEITPVLVDIDPNTFQLDPHDLASKMSYKRIDAVILFHLFGSVVDMSSINTILPENVPTIEVVTGSMNRYAFHQDVPQVRTLATASLTEAMGALGDAGMIWGNNKSLIEKIRAIRAENRDFEFHTGVTSGNFHQDTIHAGYLLRTFSAWQSEMRKRVDTISQLIEEVAKDERIVIPPASAYGTKLVIFAQQRDALQTYLHRQGIHAELFWHEPIYAQPGFTHLGHKKGDFPNAEWAAERSLYLPFPDNHRNAHLYATALNRFMKRG